MNQDVGMGANFLKDFPMDVSVLFEPHIDVPRIAHVLDGLGHEGRVHTVSTWSRAQMLDLFDALEGRHPVAKTDLRPSSTPAETEAVHDGRNTLALGRVFQKRFVDGPSGDFLLLGRNRHAFSVWTGPGVFGVREGEKPHELVFDYDVPVERFPRAWEPRTVRSQTIGRLVYGGLVDVVRKLSNHVTLGRAFRHGHDLEHAFALVRRDPVPAH